MSASTASPGLAELVEQHVGGARHGAAHRLEDRDHQAAAVGVAVAAGVPGGAAAALLLRRALDRQRLAVARPGATTSRQPSSMARVMRAATLGPRQLGRGRAEIPGPMSGAKPIPAPERQRRDRRRWPRRPARTGAAVRRMCDCWLIERGGDADRLDRRRVVEVRDDDERLDRHPPRPARRAGRRPGGAASVGSPVTSTSAEDAPARPRRRGRAGRRARSAAAAGSRCRASRAGARSSASHASGSGPLAWPIGLQPVSAGGVLAIGHRLAGCQACRRRADRPPRARRTPRASSALVVARRRAGAVRRAGPRGGRPRGARRHRER